MSAALLCSGLPPSTVGPGARYKIRCDFIVTCFGCHVSPAIQQALAPVQFAKDGKVLAESLHGALRRNTRNFSQTAR